MCFTKITNLSACEIVLQDDSEDHCMAISKCMDNDLLSLIKKALSFIEQSDNTSYSTH